MKTLKFRIKGNTKQLDRLAGLVNFVWNYCNDTAIQYLDKQGKWISGYDLHKLTSGCSTELGLSAKTIQNVCFEYAQRRFQFKRRKLSWRSQKRSLGWIPLNVQSFSVNGDEVIFMGNRYRFWKSREIEGQIKCGSFTQDAKGNWYVCFTCSTEKKQAIKSGGEIGIDLGLKTLVTLSNGDKLSRENITTKYADKLAMSQRACKKKQVRNINTKIKNVRKDGNHKETTKLINRFDRIVVGNVSPSKLKKTRMAKSVSDAGWADFKSMLAYKAVALGVDYQEVKENFSTVTCSVCFERTGPCGLSALGVREWTCKCGALHDRDVNAARNILRFGHESPIKGVLQKMPRNYKQNSLSGIRGF